MNFPRAWQPLSHLLRHTFFQILLSRIIFYLNFYLLFLSFISVGNCVKRIELLYMRDTNILLLLPSSLLFKNMARWGLSQSPDCSFCLNPESLFHVVGVCQQHLDRFTWRHDSILNFIAKSLQPVINVHSSLYNNVNGFLNPSIITGENYRPNLLFLIQSKCLYVLEFTVGFESNLNNNAVRKKEEYLNLIK